MQTIKIVAIENKTIYPTKPTKVICEMEIEPNGLYEITLEENMIFKNMSIVSSRVTNTKRIELIIANHNAVAEYEINKDAVIGNAFILFGLSS